MPTRAAPAYARARRALLNLLPSPVAVDVRTEDGTQAALVIAGNSLEVQWAGDGNFSDVRATVSETRDATGLSTGSCAAALRFLTDEGLLTAEAERGRRSARRLEDPDHLLGAYARAVQAQAAGPRLQVGLLGQDLLEEVATTGRIWNKGGVQWAATGGAAATVLAPYLTGVGSVEVYVDADTLPGLEAVAARAELRPIEGGRMTLRPFPTAAVRQLANEVEGLRVAPWPRVYVSTRRPRAFEARRRRNISGRSCVPDESPRSRAACAAAEQALIRVVHHYGGRPEFVLLGGLVPQLLCSTSDVRHAGTTGVDVQVDLEIALGSTSAERLERALRNAEFTPDGQRAWRWVAQGPADGHRRCRDLHRTVHGPRPVQSLDTLLITGDSDDVGRIDLDYFVTDSPKDPPTDPAAIGFIWLIGA